MADVDPATRGRIEEWAKKLVDLSRRNRLLYYRPTKRTTLTFRDPLPDKILGRLLSGSAWMFYQPPEIPRLPPGTPAVASPLESVLFSRPRADREIVTTQRDPLEIDRSLEAISRKARAEFEDRGTHVLHFAWGLLRWRDAKADEDVHAPLVLVPVELRRSSVRERYELHAVAGDDPAINPALRVKLESEFGLSLPDLDPAEIPPEQLVEALSRDLPKTWSVQPHAAIGIFSFAKEGMYRDLVGNAIAVAKHPVIHSMVKGRAVAELRKALDVAIPQEHELDGPGISVAGYSVIDADSSQRRAIEAANRGLSFVLYGPPGTGKSQTISNVIAEFIGRGKSVLFVSEKIAALEVVANRLEEVELRDLVLELHSAKASRGEVAQALANALDSHLAAKDGSLASVAGRLTDNRERLNGYVGALHSERAPLHRSVFEVLSELSALHSVPAIEGPKIDARKASRSSLDALESDIARLRDAWQPVVEGASFPWRDAEAPGATSAQRERVADVLVSAREAVATLQELDSRLAAAVELPESRSQAGRRRLSALGRLLTARAVGPIEWLTHDAIEPYEKLLATWSRLSAQHRELSESLASDHGPEWRRLSPESGIRLGRAQENLTKRLGKTSDWDSLASQSRAYHETVASIRRHLEVSEEPVSGLRLALGLGSTGDSIEEIQQVVAVARISQQRQRPPASWLSRARLADATNFIATHGEAYVAQQQALGRLRERYEAQLLELDLDAISARMRAWHGHWWNILRPAHRRDRAAIASVTKGSRLLPSVLADLDEAIALKRSRDQLLSIDHEARQVLGPYADGLETDIASARVAAAAAASLLALPHESTDWARLSSAVSAESAVDPSIEHLADRAELAVGEAARLLGELGQVLEPRASGMLLIAPRAWLTEWLDGLSIELGEFEGALATIDATRKIPAPAVSVAMAEAEQRAQIHGIERSLAESEDRLSSALRAFYAGFETDWEGMLAALQWSVALREYYDRRPVPASVADRILSGDLESLEWLAYERKTDEVESLAERVGELFAQSRRDPIAEVIGGSAGEAKRWLDELIMRIDDLGVWHSFAAARATLDQAGWSRFVDRAIERKTDPDLLQAAARRAWLEAWFGSVAASDPALATFSREEHERTIQAFRRADTSLIELGREQVLRAYAGRKPPPLTVQGGEQAIVRREAVKKRRHLPVRALLGAIPALLPRIKPCLMMSPLSVSHFLTPESRFDVVIFDEASQVPPEDAINCIYRGRQLIVAGDPKQLPPTDFFQLSASGEQDTEIDEQIDDFESVLDLCRAIGLPAQPLEWHYRSRHDDLIAFSNHFIYGDALVTFPAPFQHSDELGVKFIHVPDGVFDRGRTASNPIEARKVVDVVAEQVRANPALTIGVVAFSVAQQDAIQDELARRLRIEPHLESYLGEGRLNGFFVKNLETVQGDERDIIVFSIGYGRDENGKVFQNFGPINRQGGSRRLNVAVTRARRKVIVVSSITAKDLSLPTAVPRPGALPPGASLLRAYLEYAERGASETDGVGVPADKLGPLEDDVADVIRGLGYEVMTRVGTSRYRVDLGVLSRTQPGRVALGVECDGGMYESARTARDRDRLRQAVLEGLGWRIHRIWVQDWYFRRSAAIEGLSRAIDAAERSLRSKASEPSSKATVEPEPSLQRPERARVTLEEIDIRDSLDVAQLPWVRPYGIVQIEPYGSEAFAEFHDPWLHQQHATRIGSLVSEEGPVHERYIAMRLSRAYGLQRAGNRIVDAVDYAIELAQRAGSAQRRGPFVWPSSGPGAELTYVRVPVHGEEFSERTVDRIPPEEIDLALLRVADTALSIDPNALRTQVARVFGFDRTGGKIGEAFDVRIAALVSDHTLTRASGGLLALGPSVALPRLERSVTPSTYGVGDYVRHPRLGVGRVVKVAGSIVSLEIGGDVKQIETKVIDLIREPNRRRS